MTSQIETGFRRIEEIMREIWPDLISQNGEASARIFLGRLGRMTGEVMSTPGQTVKQARHVMESGQICPKCGEPLYPNW